jgi:hypothetical protein
MPNKPERAGPHLQVDCSRMAHVGSVGWHAMWQILRRRGVFFSLLQCMQPFLAASFLLFADFMVTMTGAFKSQSLRE